MAVSGNFGTPLTRFAAPWGAPHKVLVSQFAWRPRAISAHPSHVSLPHGELHLRSQWRSSHGGLGQFRHTPHTLRGPI
eukprot:4727264-Pyramimonas_sp.AAC.1